MKVGILGSGEVAKALAGGFLRNGHEVTLGTRTASKLADWNAKNPKARVDSFANVAAFGKLVVLAVKGTAAADALRAAGDANLAGKPVIDTTNPIADAPPSNGVLKFFTNLDDSLMERLQREFGGAHLVKAFAAPPASPAYSGFSHGEFRMCRSSTTRATAHARAPNDRSSSDRFQ